MLRIRTALALGAALATGACSLAPPYQRPTLATPPTFKEVRGWRTAGSDVPVPGRWWEAFADPTLNGLEARIEGGNFSLAAAAARYAQAQQLVREARADRALQVNLEGDAARARVSAGRPLAPNGAGTYTDISIGASLAYELDLFGRIRNQVRANEYAAQASAADEAGVRLGLQAQLASTYFDLRGLDVRIVLLRQTVEAYGRAFKLTDTRHSGGIASGIDVSRAAAQLSSARAELSAVSIDRQRNEHAIAVLVGEAPAAFAIAVDDRQLAPPAVPAGVPSELLERRPDIAAAERRAASANAQIGVARAALYPSLTLGASGGFEAGGSSILSLANSFWGIGPATVLLPLLDGGRRRAQVRITRARYDEAVANYRDTVLTAFREVEDDLSSARLLSAQEIDQSAAAKAAERTRDLALIRYRDGASDYLEVVTAQTAALDAARALIEVRSTQLQTAADTFRALGGGFQAQEGDAPLGVTSPAAGRSR